MNEFITLLVALCMGPCATFPAMRGEPCDCPAGSGCTNATRAVMDESNLTGSATDKLTTTWKAMMADQRSRGYMNPLKTLMKGASKSYLESMSNFPTETRPATHQKITHGIGGHAKVHFEWCKNKYTGMFQKADQCVIRIANAAAPSKSFFNPTSYNPNMAIKCFRDGEAESANLLTIWEIDGYNVIPEGKRSSCSFFDVSLSNHCGNRDNMTFSLKNTFIKFFDMVDGRSLMLGVSPMAEATQEGEKVAKPNFPFALVFRPHPDLAKAPCEFGNPSTQLRSIPEYLGPDWQKKAFYDVFAVQDPWYSRPQGKPDIELIGSMYLDSPFQTSMYGDTQLFFRHRFMKDEMQIMKNVNESRASEWQAYSDPTSATGKSHNKAEGAAWYQPFLPTDIQSCAQGAEEVVLV